MTLWMYASWRWGIRLHRFVSALPFYVSALDKFNIFHGSTLSITLFLFGVWQNGGRSGSATFCSRPVFLGFYFLFTCSFSLSLPIIRVICVRRFVLKALIVFYKNRFSFWNALLVRPFNREMLDTVKVTKFTAKNSIHPTPNLHVWICW